MNLRVAVRAIIVNNGLLLCAQAKPYNEHIVTGRWGVPGGGIDPGEAVIPALERELFEELGIKPLVGNLLYIQQFVSDSVSDNLEFFFHIKNPSDFLNIDLSKTSHGHKEIARLEFIEPANNIILPEFLQTEPLIDLKNQPVKIFNYL